MRVISRRPLLEFGRQHADAIDPLDAWFRIMKRERFQNPNEVKARLGQTDFIGDTLAVFDIGGNKYRIVADVVFRFQIVYVKHVFTHREYDAWNKTRRRRR